MAVHPFVDLADGLAALRGIGPGPDAFQRVRSEAQASETTLGIGVVPDA